MREIRWELTRIDWFEPWRNWMSRGVSFLWKETGLFHAEKEEDLELEGQLAEKGK